MLFNEIVLSSTVFYINSIEQRTNSSQSAVSRWTTVLKVLASDLDQLYIGEVNVTNEYDNLEYRIVCNWLDFSKEQPGRPSPPSAVVKPAAHCIG